MKLLRTLSIGTVTAAAALTGGILAAPAAVAAPAPVFNNLQACNDAGVAEVTKAGGPRSGLTYYCDKIYGVDAGVAGCPPNASDGCIGEYYVLHTRSV